ncbi:pyruvate formate-lyase-activating protein [Clostridium magnum]|uniref:Pyruvate formate-lyase-activating enzyme n=1 Tax=Clostridium magnum DSM 2767 TaxID=1121326 RepID=A0A161WJY8_9CLOT|nr:pyruvate formate-lyase-activating protein [Clostridium magnum]KZL92085.1 pyruvate formate-lyase 1-activating enzyme [Clostridium magnum DSM 2767]SHH23063.1 pyruvate formate lyase activating enzyme [Clostridium magnum DSM 2767]
MIVGRIHSFESMGLVDGPGIRSIVFLQGCALRCAYCHNPDTWAFSGGKEMTPEEVVKKVSRFKPYFKDNGGVTFSGGDPLMQPEFLIETLKLCKEAGIHTTIDTSGYGKGKYEEILKYTDLVLLDIKHVDDAGYRSLVEAPKKGFDQFLEAVQKAGTKLWIRHVVVPGITDSEEHIKKLAQIIREIKNVEKIELLPYHTLGAQKYEKMELDYKLEGVESMDKEDLAKLEKVLKDELEKN